MTTTPSILNERQIALLVLITQSQTTSSALLHTYNILVSMGDPNFENRWPKDETDPISLNYTSDTT